MFGKNKDEKKAKSYTYSGAVLDNSVKFAISEAYKIARTNMLFSVASDDFHTVVFTSASSHEGKSTTSINMAVSVAKAGKKTLLIDADMRKPTIDRRLKIENKKGLSDILGGFCTIEEGTSYGVYENLDVIGTVTIPPNPSELLGSKRMEETIKTLQAKYEMILIDTPPVDIVIDSQLMNKYISGIVFIVKENSTMHPDLRRSLNNIELADGKVIGFIKTSCEPKEKSSYRGKYTGKYGRKYGRYGRYGSTYAYMPSNNSKVTKEKSSK